VYRLSSERPSAVQIVCVFESALSCFDIFPRWFPWCDVLGVHGLKVCYGVWVCRPGRMLEQNAFGVKWTASRPVHPCPGSPVIPRSARAIGMKSKDHLFGKGPVRQGRQGQFDFHYLRRLGRCPATRLVLAFRRLFSAGFKRPNHASLGTGFVTVWQGYHGRVRRISAPRFDMIMAPPVEAYGSSRY